MVFEACLVAYKIEQGFLAKGTVKVNGTGRTFMDRPGHIAEMRRSQRLSPAFLRLYAKRKPVLPQHDFVLADMQKFGTQIRTDPMLLPVQQQKSDAADKAAAEKRDIRHGKHDAVAVAAALGPEVAPRKRNSAVALRISGSFIKMDFPSVYYEVSVDSMKQTEYAVTAFHKRNKAKGTHNIILRPKKGAVIQFSSDLIIFGFHIQYTSQF